MRRYPAISVAPAHLPNEVGQRSVADPRCCSIGRRLKSIMSADRDKARPSPESGIRRAHEAEKARRLDVAAGVDRVRRYFQHASRDRHTRRMEDRKRVVQGKSVSVRVDLGGRRIIKKKKANTQHKTTK